MIVDPACGDGAFLRGALAELGGVVRAIGVEVDPDVARQAEQSLEGRAEVVCADALARSGSPPLEDASVDLVVLNPPYIGEKGHRELFAHTAALGPRWQGRSTARMDYLYFFMHLALDLLRPGGRLVALTTAYWPGATSARLLRRDLCERGVVVEWVRFSGPSIFADAPGQHNLGVVVERRAASDRASRPYSWAEVSVPRGCEPVVSGEFEGVQAPSTDDPWQPFVDLDTQRWSARVGARWTPLGTVAHDSQGVVSGCDRVTARHKLPDVPLGTPVFLMSGPEIVARSWHEDGEIEPLLEPLLRGSRVVPFELRTTRSSITAPDAEVLLYLHRGSREPPRAVLEHLEKARTVLERRREVQQGRIPWWALHWPRNQTTMRSPKLVTARRAKGFAFCLDLAGHLVSSDCTVLTPRVGLEDPLENLVALWVTLHLPDVARLMRTQGKLKGDLIEFYRQPLRGLGLPLDQDLLGRLRTSTPRPFRDAARTALARAVEAPTVHEGLVKILRRWARSPV